MAGATDFYRLATLGPGSSPYLVMSTFAQLVHEQLPDVEIQVNATGAATQHAIDAAKGDLDFFMWSASVHAYMEQGKAMYAKIPEAPELAKHLRAVFAFPLGLYHITTYADSGIKSLDDIKGKKVFLGPPGGGATAIMQQVVEGATGYKTGEDFESVQLGWDAAAQAFQDGRIDVYINSTNAPSPIIEQMALSRKIRFLGLTDEEMKKPEVAKILGRPGGTLGVIEPGTYGTEPGQHRGGADPRFDGRHRCRAITSRPTPSTPSPRRSGRRGRRRQRRRRGCARCRLMVRSTISTCRSIRARRATTRRSA